jgi:hypothetical protein
VYSIAVGFIITSHMRFSSHLRMTGIYKKIHCRVCRQSCDTQNGKFFQIVSPVNCSYCSYPKVKAPLAKPLPCNQENDCNCKC